MGGRRVGFEGAVWQGTRVRSRCSAFRGYAVLLATLGERAREFGKWLKEQETGHGESRRAVRVEAGESGQAWSGSLHTRCVKGTRVRSWVGVSASGLMAGHLPSVRDLRLHPDERPGDVGGQWSLGGDAVAEQQPRSSEQVHESTIAFKDLATLVAVVLDRKDAIDRAGAGVCARTQGACLSGSGWSYSARAPHLLRPLTATRAPHLQQPPRVRGQPTLHSIYPSSLQHRPSQKIQQICWQPMRSRWGHTQRSVVGRAMTQVLRLFSQAPAWRNMLERLEGLVVVLLSRQRSRRLPRVHFAVPRSHKRTLLPTRPGKPAAAACRAKHGTSRCAVHPSMLMPES